jgi:hypothetical protein
VQFNGHETGGGELIRRHAGQLGHEGVVSKTINTPYAPGNRGLWRKSKCLNRLVIIGWTGPEGSRPYLGALLLGCYDDDGGSNEVLIWSCDESAPYHPHLFRANGARIGLQALLDSALQFSPATCPIASSEAQAVPAPAAPDIQLPDLTTWGETGAIGKLRVLSSGR